MRPAQPLQRVRIGADWPSYAFLLGVAANTVLIVNLSHRLVQAPLVLVLLALVQALLLIGCQEAKHLCVHSTFLKWRWANSAVGALSGALVGINFFAYRHFHFQHHRTTCTADDPEGQLYQLSWPTRWIWFLAPLEVLWVAYHLNKVGAAVTPLHGRAVATAGLVFVWLVAALLGVLAWYFPQAMLWAYLVPLVLSSWIEFLLKQAEHYGVAVAAAGSRRDAGALTNDLVLPLGLGWLTLHGSLHRVHHCQPGIRWFHAPAQLRHSGVPPMSYAAFARRWLAQGPRLWLVDPANSNSEAPISESAVSA